MSDLEARRAAMQNLWNVYRSIFAKRAKPFDVAERLFKWAEEKRQSLVSDGADVIFDKLCKEGCSALPLAFALAIVKPLQSFGLKWQRITGTPRQRRQKIRTIERATGVIEDLLGLLLLERFGEMLEGDSVREFQEELITSGERLLEPEMARFAFDPLDLIRALRASAGILSLFDTSAEEGSTPPPDTAAKYLFSAYVYRATGRFHDEEVSSLIGSALGVGPDYDPAAHKMWRKRNYRRIDKRLGSLVDQLNDFGKILPK